MSDWDRLRDGARELRTLASRVPEPVADVQRRYRPGELWQGPAADRFFGALGTARSRLDGCVADLVSYAAALDREAERREQRHRQQPRH